MMTALTGQRTVIWRKREAGAPESPLWANCILLPHHKSYNLPSIVCMDRNDADAMMNILLTRAKRRLLFSIHSSSTLLQGMDQIKEVWGEARRQCRPDHVLCP
ncbi:unnamed protein product [Musa hybrid cultivar]